MICEKSGIFRPSPDLPGGGEAHIPRTQLMSFDNPISPLGPLPLAVQCLYLSLRQIASPYIPSTMNKLNPFLVLGTVCSQLGLVSAATITHDFNITWVTANPDGAFSRPTIGINGQWPIPRIDANVGDRIIVNVNNQLGNQSTSLHFHGLFMNNSQTHMDGPSMTAQCPIPPGQSFTYNFTVSGYCSGIHCSKDAGEC